jgi:hypothetical protein
MQPSLALLLPNKFNSPVDLIQNANPIWLVSMQNVLILAQSILVHILLSVELKIISIIVVVQMDSLVMESLFAKRIMFQWLNAETMMIAHQIWLVLTNGVKILAQAIVVDMTQNASLLDIIQLVIVLLVWLEIRKTNASNLSVRKTRIVLSTSLVSTTSAVILAF